MKYLAQLTTGSMIVCPACAVRGFVLTQSQFYGYGSSPLSAINLLIRDNVFITLDRFFSFKHFIQLFATASLNTSHDQEYIFSPTLGLIILYRYNINNE